MKKTTKKATKKKAAKRNKSQNKSYTNKSNESTSESQKETKPGADAASIFIKKYCLFYPRGRSSSDSLCKLIWWKGRFYFWTDGLYKHVSDGDMKAWIVASLREGEIVPTINAVGKVMLNLKGMTRVRNDIEPGSWIGNDQGPRAMVAQNGIITFDNLDRRGRPKLLAHTPEYFNLIQLPYDYDPDAECPLWLEFLDEIMDGDQDRIRLLQQWCGYLLTPTLKEQKFLICVGDGANGKGVFTLVLIEMLGPDNCSSVSVGHFGRTYASYETYGKLLNATTEGSRDIKPQTEEFIKKYTAGDMITFERKYCDPFSGIPTAKLMISTNELPHFKDKSEGIWRRLLLVPFEITFTKDEQNKKLVEELKEELPGIFNWAYEGMVDLEQNGFIEPSRCKEAIELYRRDVNPAKVFLEENYKEVIGAESVSCGSVYTNYQKWCKAKGYKSQNDANFGKEVRKVFPTVDKTRPRRKGRRIQIYSNLSIRKDAIINGPEFM